MQNENDELKSQATGVSAGKKIKTYIPLFADFVASLFYIAVVVLVLKPSLLKEKALILADRVSEKVNESEKFTKVLEVGEKIFKIEKTEIEPPSEIDFKVVVLALLFFYAGRFILVYLLGKIICICFSAVPFRRSVPFLLVVLQVLCLALFKYNYGWLMFIAFSLLLYIAFQTTVGCNGEIIRKKIRKLFAIFLIGYVLANIVFVKEVQDCLRELVSLLRPMI